MALGGFVHRQQRRPDPHFFFFLLPLSHLLRQGQGEQRGLEGPGKEALGHGAEGAHELGPLPGGALDLHLLFGWGI